MRDRFGHSRHLIRRQALKLFGGALRVYDPSGELVLFADLKDFRLREDVSAQADEAKLTEVLTIKARQTIGLSAACDVVDVTKRKEVGALLKSLFRDEWVLWMHRTPISASS